jgi:hypothetical protein
VPVKARPKICLDFVGSAKLATGSLITARSFCMAARMAQELGTP